MIGTDYAISSTGHADPSDKKCGRVFLAIASPEKIYTKKLDIKLRDRNRIITAATNNAIEFLYEVLRKENL